MDYQGYEDYMRSVLGYNTGNIFANTYNPMSDYYYDMTTVYTNTNADDLNEFYPEIYKLLYPMVCKVCNQNFNREITKDLIDRMTDEIYINFEAEERPSQNNMRTQPLKNGDVRNPNAKEPEVRQIPGGRNFLLRDLIRILILKEWGRPNRPPVRPPVSRPPMGPGMPQPPRPGNGRPPINPPPRPRYY